MNMMEIIQRGCNKYLLLQLIICIGAKVENKDLLIISCTAHERNTERIPL